MLSTDEKPDLWIFGYGSLVWRPEFPFAERRHGYVRHWARRFWQGSTDHRGIPEQPGRVATLVRERDTICWGSAYRVSQGARARVLAQLDWRERGGFERDEVQVVIEDSCSALPALMYVATPENPNYLGPAPLPAIAAQVARCSGPSGPSIEYVLRLEEALREMGADDPHVFELAELLRDSSRRLSS